MTLLPDPRPVIYRPNTWDRENYKFVACEKLDDSLNLYQNGRYMAAMYLAGYAIECSFQSLYCFQKSLRVTNIRSDAHSVEKFVNMPGRLYSTTQMAIINMNDAWINVRNYWNGTQMFQLRYNPNNTTQADAEIFICSVCKIHKYVASEIDIASTPPGLHNPAPSNYINKANSVHARIDAIISCSALGL